MSHDDDKDITLMLHAAAGGDRQAAEALLPRVYSELQALARARLAKLPPGQTLSGTDLVHEAYLRLVGNGDPGWNSRGHFFGAAARAMRNIIVERARYKQAERHGGGRQRLSLEGIHIVIRPPSDDILALNELLERLEADDPRKAQIVDLRYFVGLTVRQTADALGVSVGTIEREWRYIRPWLATHLSNGHIAAASLDSAEGAADPPDTPPASADDE